MKKNHKKHKKIRIMGLLFLLLFIYLILTLIYYFLKMPIKNINIKGNYILTDTKIISEANINYKDSIFKISTNKIKKDLEKDPLINKAYIKRKLNGTIEIEIEENKILFLN